MSKFDMLLVNLMDVTRPDPANEDDDTGTPEDTPTIVVAANAPCLLQVLAPGREFIVGKQSVIADWRIYSRAVAGLREDCSIVVNGSGLVPDGTEFDVLFVAPYNDGVGAFHHLETYVKEIRA